MIYLQAESVSKKDSLPVTYEDKIEVINKYCLENNIDIDKTYYENTNSHKLMDKPQLISALNYVSKRKNNISLFIVYQKDDLSKNIEGYIQLKALLLKSGVKFCSLSELRQDNSCDQLMKAIFDAFAQFDNQRRGKAIKLGLARRKEHLAQ